MDIDDELIDIGEEEKEELQNTPELDQSFTTDQWQSQTMTSSNSDMDDESRKLIEQMLAEEEFYYGKDSLDSTKSFKKRKGKHSDADYDLNHSIGSKPNSLAKRSKKEGAISSASLPSHKTRWNLEEDDLLRHALIKFGYGNWKLISEYVKTRNPLQCKNHARHLTQTDKVDLTGIQHSKQPSESITASKDKTVTVTAIKDVENSSKSKDGPFLKVGNIQDLDSSKSKDGTFVKMENIQDLAENVRLEDEDDELSIDGSENVKSGHTLIPAPAPIMPYIDEKDGVDSSIKQKDIPVSTTNNNKIPESSVQSENGHNTVSIFDRSQVSEEEMAQNPEWFKQKYSKTPDRYLKIRNHMLDCWKQCKPKYLTKTSARKGLKDCGDVNAIGRVHQYLESIGAINVDCVTNAPRPPIRVPREVFEQDEMEEFDASELVLGYDGPRKRKVRNEKGEWVDPRELEGRVIEHGQTVVQLDPKPKRVTKRPNQYYGGDDFGRGYDPFRLVPTDHYSDDLPAPFEVEIVSDALLVMDFHSHLAHTEIIGLLGGNFINRNDSKILQVKSVFPCQSTSTGIQCEMDPTSEMRAREEFADKGYDVVGWYHSHPTFEPHPSIRDIENQTSYQTLFRKEVTGDEPFIGVIVTPYDPENVSDHSQIQYLHISKEWNDSLSYRVPYACRRTVIQSEEVSSIIFNQLIDLINEYKGYEHKVAMQSQFGTQTRLQKLLDSLRAHLFLSQQDEELFIEAVKGAVIKDFIDENVQEFNVKAALDENHSARQDYNQNSEAGSAQNNETPDNLDLANITHDVDISPMPTKE